MANRMFVKLVSLIINFDLPLDDYNYIKRMRNGEKVISLYYDTEVDHVLHTTVKDQKYQKQKCSTQQFYSGFT